MVSNIFELPTLNNQTKILTSFWKEDSKNVYFYLPDTFNFQVRANFCTRIFATQILNFSSPPPPQITLYIILMWNFA